MIDFQFENKTKAFMRKQFAWYLLTCLVPFLILISGILESQAFYIVMFISWFGQLGIYMLELMAIKVQGLAVYLSDKWNILD